MQKKMGLGAKVMGGFALVMIILVIIGGVSWNALSGAAEGFKSYRGLARDTNLMGRVQANLLMMRLNVKDFLITGSEKDIQQFNEYNQKTNEFLETARKEIQNPERAGKVKSVSTEYVNYLEGFKNISQFMAERDNQVNGILNVKGPLLEKNVTEIMNSAYKNQDQDTVYRSGLMMKHLLLARLYMTKFLDTNDQAAVNRVHQEFEKLEQQFNLLNSDDRNTGYRQWLANVAEAEKEYISTFNLLVKTISQRNDVTHNTMDRLGPVMAGDIEDIKLSVKEEQDVLGPKLQAENIRAVVIIVVISLLGLALGVILAVVITRSITKPINRIIDNLNEGSDQVASASFQISSSSQALAEGASEQAAAIEETSSSLEEMASMTKQNANNAGEADVLMKEATQVVAKANETMAELTQSMALISGASEETSKIIKTIDEIAFQTNLLALNAAVEAARAGEAGAGFAVVADEVRNLAIRAAEAAKNTSNLIEDTITQVTNGSNLVSKTNEAFQEVSKSTGKVGELVGEIAAASQEQAQGIDQVNQAVNQMDQVIQSNAANAEESASASEEMNAQAENMRDVVNDLVKLVMGMSKANGDGNHQKPLLPAHRRITSREKPDQQKTLTTRDAQVVKSNEVIAAKDDYLEF